MTNLNNTTLYVGVTSNLLNRVHEHKNQIHPDSFTSRFRLFKLVYFEGYKNIEEAIAREKQLKAGSRKRKIELVRNINPHWRDLWDEIGEMR